MVSNPGTTLQDAVEAEREKASDLLDALVHDAEGIIEAADLAAIDEEHDPDGVTNGYERAKASALIEQVRSRIEELDAALLRLDDGTYGTCAVCEHEIGIERLEALPGTKTCIHCAS